MKAEIPAALTWRVVSAAEAAERWDGWLSDFRDHHVRQCHAWGQYKKGGWEPLYTGLFNGPAPMALGLCLRRSLPAKAGTVVWLNGGPAFAMSRPRAQDLAALGHYLEGLKAHFSSARAALRLLHYAPMDLEAQFVLRQKGFERPLSHVVATPLTYVVDLTRSLDELRAGMDHTWRNRLKSAEKASPVFTMGRERALLERYLPIHNETCRLKGLKGQELSLPELSAMAASLGARVTFFVGQVDGQDGCGGAWWTFGRKAVFALSAANELGRRRYLPNAMYWNMFRNLKEQGFESLDLTGIDPRDGWGVFNFKKGLNAAPVEYLGEWEWAASSWTRRLFNLALWARGGALG